MTGATNQPAELDFPGFSTSGKHKFVSPHTRVRLVTYPLDDRHPFAPQARSGSRVFDWSEDSVGSVVSLDWSKQMGQASGSWTAKLKTKHDERTGDARARLDQFEIRDGDWADITVLRNGVPIPLMRGVVDSVRRRRYSVQGASAVEYTVTGRDHGAFFEYPITWSSVWVRTLDETVRGLFTDRLDGKVGGSPDELFAALIQGTFGVGTDATGVPSGQWMIPQSLRDKMPGGDFRRLNDVLSVITFDAIQGTKGLRGAYYNQPQLWTVGEQDLHQTLQQWSNPLLNETWYDLALPRAFVPQNGLHKFLSTSTDRFRDRSGAQVPTTETEQWGTMCAFCRERPFPTTEQGIDSMWFNLPTWSIPTWLLQQDDLGVSGHDRSNLMELTADIGLGSQPEQIAAARPLWNIEDIRLRGLRTYSKSTNYIARGADKGYGDWLTERSTWLAILRDWFGPNPYMTNGSLSVKALLPEVRIGQRLILDTGSPSQNEQFYVEGVSGQWHAAQEHAGENGSTTFTVTRGFQGTDTDLNSQIKEAANLFKETF